MRGPFDTPGGPGKGGKALALDQAMARAEAAFDAGDRAGAARICRQILTRKADYFYALNLLGILRAESGGLDEAAKLLARAAAANPKEVSVHINRANVLMGLKRHEEALASFDRALALPPGTAPGATPDFADVHTNRALVLKALGRLEDAREGFDRALALDPRHMQAHLHGGRTLLQLGRPDAALARFDAILAMAPDHAGALFSRAAALKALGRAADALDAYDRMLVLHPDDAAAHSSRGVVLQDLNRTDEALAAFDRALELDPGLNDALWNRSFCRLLTGDFTHGWDGFERRWDESRQAGTTTQTTHRKMQLAPDWDGRALDGRLLVLKEQGVGDEIFYSGMLNELKPLARAVTVCVDPRLAALYRRSFGGIDVLPATELTTAMTFDAQIYMGDLGRHLRARPEPFREAAPYLRADAARAAQLRARLKPEGRRLCGLSWISKSAVRGTEKSLSLRDLVPLLQRPDLGFVDLQYGDTGAEQETLRHETGLALARAADIDAFNDLDGLAALIAACDMVLTVSNTTAHLAAALGKPTWVMLPHAPGLLWYWHLGRADSPWYPGARLFRQDKAGDWAGVIERVAAALAEE